MSILPRSASSAAPARHRARHRSKRSPLFSALAGTLAVLLGLGTVVALNLAGDPAEAAGDLVVTTSVTASADASGDAFVVAGDTFDLSVAMENISDPTRDLYNAAFTVLVPVGLEFVSGGSLLGSPRVVTGTAFGVAPGFELWVWEDVADLPIGASLTGTVTVRPSQPAIGTGETSDVDVFPVGSDIEILSSAYASDDARLLPLFPGSTGGALNSNHNASGNQVLDTVPVEAIDVEKSEPSPEHELVRGVHDEHTMYTITVRNTSEGATQNVVVVDYLPAGLEYIGDASIDNSTGDEEYPDSGVIAGSAPENYRQATTVETITAGAGDPSYLTPGAVYTKVTWVIGTLAAAETLTIDYLAAVPLYENTMSFTGGTPGTAGAQTANLDNNNGPSTREGTTALPGSDGMSLTNFAGASGQYQGVVRTGADRATEDSADVTVVAEDLAIIKSAPADPFSVGGTAMYTLTLRTGEYASASGIVGIDVLPDGLYPILPASLQGTAGFVGLPAAWFSGTDASVVGADIVSIDYTPAVDGTVTITFLPTDAAGDPLVLEPSSEHPITYSVGMRATYDRDNNARGQTTAGDSFTNTVSITGQTTSLPELGGDVYYVTDDSSSTMGSRDSLVTKDVLPRDAITGFDVDGTPTFDDEDFVDGTAVVPGGFVVGDTVVYRLSVQFPNGIDTRNPVLVDMLPAGVSYKGWAYGPDNTLAAAERNTPTEDVDRLRWAPGYTHSSGDRFVTAGTLLEILVWGTVEQLSDGSAATQDDSLDKPENLVKYRYENVNGDVFFSRDQASVLLEPGVSLLKGVRDVGGAANRAADSSASGDGTAFNSNRDGIQVVQEELVTYRIDIEAPRYASENIVVWDALPDGITTADVGSFSVATRAGVPVTDFTATPLAPANHPAGVHSDFSDNTLIVWEIDAMAASTDAASAGLTLFYTVTVPLGSQIEQEYDNTASIVRYDAESNGGSTTPNVTIVPESPISTTPAGADEYAADGTHTSDDSIVYLPDAEIEKVVHTSEITTDPNGSAQNQNSATQAVQGEYITYRYSLTVPAHTTIPEGSTLADGGQLARNAAMTSTVHAYTQHGAATLVSPAAGPEYSLAADGTLTFDDDYDNLTNDPVVFTVEIVVYTDGDGFAHDNTLYNRATFTNGATNTTLTDTANVQYREINPSLAKQVRNADDVDSALVDEVQVTAGTTVEYVLTASNPADRPTSYDTVVVDCVPEALTVVTVTSPATGWALDTCDNGETQITWTVGHLAPGASATLVYTAIVDPSSAGSAVYVNEAELTGTTLPGDESSREGTVTRDADATVRIVPAIIEKSVTPGSGTIGDLFDYEVELTLPADVNFYDAVINDTLPNGLVVVGTPQLSSSYQDTSDAGLTFTPTSSHNGSTVLEWSIGDGTSEPVASNSQERTITLSYQARMVEYGTGGASPVSGNSLTNTVSFDWNITPGGTPATPVTSSATVTVTEPILAIVKKVNGLDEDRVELDETFGYSVTVTNTGNAAAHNMVVTDTVPVGVIVDESSIPNDGVLSGDDATTGGGIITWNLAGPLAPGAANAIVLSYSATLAASEHLNPAAQTPAAWWTNTAAVTHYESYPDTDHSRKYNPTTLTDTARVMPLFPFIALEKTVGSQGSIAYIDESFEWVLTLTNTGAGAAQTVTAVDTLPENWTYDAGSAMVAIAGAAPVALADPTISGQELTWAFGADAPAAPVLAGAAGTTTRSIVITFTATPQADVIDAPGIGAGIDHTNTLTAEVTDVTGSPENGGGEYIGPDDEADAQIHVADLALVKTGAAAPIVAGSTPSTGWTITVTNNGDDPAVGPFLVSDVTDPLPTGVSISGFTGSGWSLVSPGVYRYGTAATTLAAGSSLPSLGLTVTVAADFDPAELPSGEIGNTATVTSPTYDDEPGNNEDDDPITITTAADLTIEKIVTTASPNAGAPITWTITVTNDGPSVSRSSVDNPITVTDVIPAGVTNVTMPTLPAGWTSNIPTGDSLTAGDTLVLTHSGAPLGVGAPVLFTLNADVLASHLSGSITNTATVTPGETPDPEPGPPSNEDEVTTPVSPSTTLGVSKIRVVQDGTGAWVPATDPIVAGETVTYRIVVANNGPADATGVKIVDTLTEGLEAPVSHSSLVGTWTAGSSTATTYEFELTGNLLNGASASLLVTATAVSGLAADDEVVNSVLATATNDPDGDDDEDRGGPVRVADLAITKSHDSAVTTAVAGGTLGYTLVVTNLGPSYATGPIVITDTLPAGFSYVAGSSTVDGVTLAPTVSGQTLTWTIGDGSYSLADGDDITIELVTAIASTVTAGDYVNTATVDSPDDDNPVNDTTTDEIPVVTSADVTIVKTATAGPYVAGGSVSYTLTVTNAGPSVARNVTVTDAADAELTITGMSGSTGWICTVATTSCAFDGLLPVGTSTITVTAVIDSAVPAGDTLDNLATVRWTDSDGPHEDDDPETITVTAIADISIVKSLASASLDAGETGRYRLEISNDSSASDAVSVTVTDELPTGLTYSAGLTSAGNAWSYQGLDGAGNPVFALTGNLAAGASTWLEFDVSVDESVTGDVINVAIVETPTNPDPLNPPSDDETTTVGTTTNLVIVKERSGTPGDARIGDTTEFLITVTNEGPATATGVVVTDALPAGLTFAGVTTPAAGTGWTFPTPVGDLLTANLDDPLAVGESASFTVTALVELAAYPSVTNTAEVAGDNPETDYDDNESGTPVPVAPQLDLSIVKELVSPELIVGETAVYRLTVTNNGLTEDPGPITVRDVLPAGLEYVSSDNGDCDAVAGVFECVFTDTLAVGGTIVIELTVDVVGAAYPSVTNTATVSTESEDTEPTNDSSTVTDPVTPDVRFAIEKRVASYEEDTVTWEITVHSIGLNDAFNGVEVTDTLPAELSYISSSSDDGFVCTPDVGNTVICAHPDPLPSGASASFSIVTDTTQQAFGTTVTNTAEVTDGFITVPPAPVVDTANYTRNLAITGADSLWLALVGLLALLGGAALIARSRVTRAG